MSGPGAVGGASVRGFSHIRSNLPNQDCFGHAEAEGWALLAVSDGHGSSRHYRSDRGAVFAVDAALEVLRAAVRACSAQGIGPALSSVGADLVRRWRDRVEADIEAWPVRERPGFESHAVYGATCVAAAIGPEAALFVQIGDGDVLAAAPGGEVDWAIPVDPNLRGPGTYSLCQPDAAARVRARLFTPPHPLATPDFVVAATDGLSKSYRMDQEFISVIAYMRETLRSTELSELLGDLEPWLAECSRRGSRDDVTVAIFSRHGRELLRPGSKAEIAGAAPESKLSPQAG